MFGHGCRGVDPDYRKLLMKYINYIGLLEGTDFLDHRTGPGFTEEEWKELIKLSEEAFAEVMDEPFSEPIGKTE